MTKKESNIFFISFFVLYVIDFFIERYLEVTISSFVLAASGLFFLYILLRRYSMYISVPWKITCVLSQTIYTCWVLVLNFRLPFSLEEFINSNIFNIISLIVLMLFVFTNIVNLTLLVTKKARLNEEQERYVVELQGRKGW